MAFFFESESSSSSSSSSSSCSSSSEEEYLELCSGEESELCPWIQGNSDIVARYSDCEFKSHFRVSRSTFEFLVQTIGVDLLRDLPGRPTISCELQLMIALWKMGNMDSYSSVCVRFNVGKSTALRAMRRVIAALFSKAAVFIQWPSGDRAATVIQGFEVASGFPNTIGAIDGTHIRINPPRESAADYRNRKGYHSIQLQLVCDHRKLITHCYTGQPGSFHDASVFRQSEVADFLDNGEKFPHDSHLLGDAAYELHERLLTPFRDNGHLTNRQKHYNYCHSATRVTIERCIGLLKGRMRSLLRCLPMYKVSLTSVTQYIVACCVIHNICILQGDEILVISFNPQPQQDIHGDIDGEHIVEGVMQSRGAHKRNEVMEYLDLVN